ncbi:MAG: metal ABC transporter permease [Rhodobacteraceae bacterium]|nr:metal ABC transporter permease [Paracoccaceae bacterium]
MTWATGLLGSHAVQNVAIGAMMLGACAGALGCFALLRRQSLLGDAVSHAALPGICLGFLVAGGRELPALLAGALLAGGLGALSVQLILRRTRLKTDAALGIVLSVFFAVGVVLLTHIQGRGGAAQAGLSSFLFGQAAAILRGDLVVIGGLSVAALAVVALLWKEFKLLSFDPDFARAQGLPVARLEVLLTLVIAVAIVVGLQLVGVVLMVALLVAPAAAARQWARGLGSMVLLAALFGATSGLAGALASAGMRGLSTGPVVVLFATAIVAVSLLLAPRRGLLWDALRRASARRRLAGTDVLVTLHGVGQAHDDPAYPVEGGMVDAAHGLASARTLARLRSEGMVRAVTRPPETRAHWELTPLGRARAEAALRGNSGEETA